MPLVGERIWSSQWHLANATLTLPCKFSKDLHGTCHQRRVIHGVRRCLTEPLAQPRARACRVFSTSQLTETGVSKFPTLSLNNQQCQVNDLISNVSCQLMSQIRHSPDARTGTSRFCLEHYCAVIPSNASIYYTMYILYYTILYYTICKLYYIYI